MSSSVKSAPDFAMLELRGGSYYVGRDNHTNYQMILNACRGKGVETHNMPYRETHPIDSNRNDKRYILVVDDETNIIKSLMRELGDWANTEGLTVTGAVIGEEALDFIEEHRNEVELVIADIRMPGMSGGDMALRIKKRYPDIRIIVLTGFNDRNEIKKAEKAGICSFMTKPWEMDHLIGEIEKAMSYQN